MSESKYSLLTSRRRELQPPKKDGGPPPSGGSSGGGSGAALETAAGMALSGMYIYNSLAAGNKDAVEDEAKTLDSCFSHPTPFGEIHYHYWSPCIKSGQGFASTTTPSPLCKDAADN